MLDGDLRTTSDRQAEPPKKWAAKKVVIAVATFLLAAGAIADPVRNWVLWRATHGVAAPACEDPGWLEPATVSNSRASDYLPADDGVTYFPGNSVDGDMATAWVAREPTEQNDLSISWQLSRPEVVRLVCFTPGYAKSEDRFKNNQRLKRVTLSANNESQSVAIEPVAETDYQKLIAVHVGCNECKAITLIVNETYETAKGDQEVAISELVVYRDTRIWPLSLLPS